MARPGLKLFYLRTRERKLSQQHVADMMNVRQATLSNIERGLSMPSATMLLELCRFYDVTPTFLLDEDRGVVPLPSERWSLRNALVTVGMWIEVQREEAVELGGGKLLCPLRAGAHFYDDEAGRVRVESNGAEDRLGALVSSRVEQELALAEELDAELSVHPRRRGKGGSK